MCIYKYMDMKPMTLYVVHLQTADSMLRTVYVYAHVFIHTFLLHMASFKFHNAPIPSTTYCITM